MENIGLRYGWYSVRKNYHYLVGSFGKLLKKEKGEFCLILSVFFFGFFNHLTVLHGKDHA